MDQERAAFEGGVAVITGAGSGIGEGLALHAASLGMKVALADISVPRMEAVASAIRAAGGEAMTVHTDVSSPESIDRLAATVHETWGDVRLLVNNAGVETLGFIWEIPAALWEKTLDINIHGVIHGVRAFAPRMIAAGKPAWIANTSSVGGLGMMPVQAAYILSKHAVLSFTECLRLEMLVKKAPITVSAILPGPVATKIFDDTQPVQERMALHHREVMRAMLEHEGITGVEAARRIFAQLAAGEFWVTTHREMAQGMAQQRAAYLAAMATPELPPVTEQLLGSF
jgi:NAD(P)-dependent dehydrogenase (short-subunit alcohol dehydrogenase family)